MIDVELKTTEPVTVAFVEMRGAYAQIPEAMGRVYGWAAMRGLQPAGVPMAVYLTAPDAGSEADAEWEVLAPLAGDPAEQPADESGCGVRHIESQLVACTMYKGPYEGIGTPYQELGEWITRNGYELAGPPCEVYLSDPAETAPQDYLTEIRFPVVKH